MWDTKNHIWALKNTNWTIAETSMCSKEIVEMEWLWIEAERQNKWRKKRGCRSEIKHFCGKKLQNFQWLWSRVSFVFLLCDVEGYDMWRVSWSLRSTFTLGQRENTTKTLSHSSSQSKHQPNTFQGSNSQSKQHYGHVRDRPGIWLWGEKIHSRAWASPSGEQSDLAVVTQMDRTVWESAAVF